MLGKKILKIALPSIQKFDLEVTGKAGCYHCCVKDDERVSHQTEGPTEIHQSLKKTSIVMLIGGAFTGSSYLFSRQSKDSSDTERKRHDVVIEQFQKIK